MALTRYEKALLKSMLSKYDKSAIQAALDKLIKG